MVKLFALQTFPAGLLTQTLCSRQLEAHRRPHRPAVRTIFQRRERLEQKEHPGQPSPLPPLLHLTVWSRVRSSSTSGETSSASASTVNMFTCCASVHQPSTAGCGVYEGPAHQSQHHSSSGQSWRPDASRGLQKEIEGTMQKQQSSKRWFALTGEKNLIVFCWCIIFNESVSVSCFVPDQRGHQAVWDTHLPVPRLWFRWRRRLQDARTDSEGGLLFFLFFLSPLGLNASSRQI